jgi:hypothetical protein
MPKFSFCRCSNLTWHKNKYGIYIYEFTSVFMLFIYYHLFIPVFILLILHSFLKAHTFLNT